MKKFWAFFCQAKAPIKQRFTTVKSTLRLISIGLIISACSGSVTTDAETGQRATATGQSGHGPDAGSLKSIGTLFYRGEIEAAVIKSFYMASQNNRGPTTLKQIKLSDSAADYLAGEHSYMALHDALHLSLKRAKPELTVNQWQAF